MRVIFLGTSSFALPPLKSLMESVHELVLVITRPPREAGRGRKPRNPPVADYAAANELELLQPEKLNKDIISYLHSLKPDIMVSAAYGAWLPKKLLETAPFGVVNIHPSLLPAYRGAAPVARAIIDGAEDSGVSFMLTDSGWDTGPLLESFKERIMPDDTTGMLEERLSHIAAAHLQTVLERYAEGLIIPEPQKGETVYAEKITSEETWLDWNMSAEFLERQVRAFQPFPGARTEYCGNMLKIIKVSPVSMESVPGVITIENNTLSIGCGEGSLKILTLQPASKRIMAAADFLRGTSMRTGDKLGCKK
ncbi:MAG: methionyl-tRNA formyltransferase [Candidatus Aegiribacteria sp.]|nr:methionyl-tRNA formyltransferase [Candidatus Aegiribacteria sp.]